ncbi:spindle pole body-associated protein sad1 [Colletotrichum incanum]|nr:spindle pole body-associated protein sad1 [Colletotrichum incanum]
MPPKRRVRGDDDDMPVISRGGAAVTSNLPPLASRLDTSYGSAPSTALRNTRRGQRRDLQAIIKETLHDSDDPDDPEDPDDDDDDEGDDNIDDIDDGRSDRSRSTKHDNPSPMNSPSPKPVLQSRPTRKAQPAPNPDPDPDPDSDFEPDYGPGRESSESPDPLRDPSPDPTFVQSPPRQHLSARTAPSVERPSFHQAAPATRQRVLPDVAPPRGPSPSRQQPLTKETGSKGLAPPTPTGQRPSPSRGALLAASSRSVFARAISEESGSQHQERRSGEPPEPTPTPDSIRTFGQESSLFGGADIGSTPSRLSRSPEEIRQEREQEKVQQEALRKERNARLQAWPRIYNTVYSWTHAPRPDSPPPRDEDSDDYGSPIAAPQQVPLNESSWSTWILFKLADTFVDVLNFLFSPRSWLIKALLGILLVSLLGWGAVTGLNSAPALGLGGIQWYGLSDISHNLGQFIPLWMSRPSTVFSDEDKREYTRQQRNHEYELTKLARASKLHEGSLSRLEEIVPKVVHMGLDKHGRPVVGEEFWHALRDLMKSDTEILTMDRGHGGYHFISEEHWRAIRDRLKKDPVYQSAASPAVSGPSSAEIENIAQAKFNKSWEKWLKTNDKQVAKILEPALTTSIPDKIGKDLEYKIEKIVKDRFKNTDTKDVIVTRNEFIRHLKSEFATHRNEVKAEAQELQKKLEHYINDAVKSASEHAPPAGVSRLEMIQVVDGMIRQAIANAGLEALAQGKIGATWDRELRHQVNFLGRHTGVIIDDSATTPDYDPPVKGKIWSPTWFKGTQRDRKPVPASATLWNWEDEGDCWCGKVIVDKSGVELGVRVGYLLGHEIIPQHVVVEHILPGATLDPDARPKDIDVLAYITEINTRNRVKDFAAAHFPSSKINLPDGWVRIGHFTYESSDALNGVYVHKLSPELVSLGAVTDQIVLQMVSNYGSDHTCLYRARLYGEKRS